MLGQRNIARLDGHTACRAHECSGCESRLEFADAEASAQWLRRHKADGSSMSTLRHLAQSCGIAVPLARTDDDAICEQLSRMLAMGLVRICRERRVVHVATHTAPAPEAEPAPPPAKRKPAAGRGAREPEPETFPESFDAVAAALSLRRAAEAGTPFCEECEKSAAAQRAALLDAY